MAVYIDDHQYIDEVRPGTGAILNRKALRPQISQMNADLIREGSWREGWVGAKTYFHETIEE